MTAVLFDIYTVAAHESKGNIEQQLTLSVFQGSIGDTLNKAGEAGQLTDWHLALASMGKDRWHAYQS